jgi:hypothetical protein
LTPQLYYAKRIPFLYVAVYRIDAVFRKLDTVDLQSLRASGSGGHEEHRESEYEKMHDGPPLRRSDFGGAAGG